MLPKMLKTKTMTKNTKALRLVYNILDAFTPRSMQCFIQRAKKIPILPLSLVFLFPPRILFAPVSCYQISLLVLADQSRVLLALSLCRVVFALCDTWDDVLKLATEY